MSLRLRLILSYVLIIILCLGISMISVSLVLQKYRDQVVQIRLDDLTRPISNQIKSLVKNQITVAQFWNNIQTLAKDYDTYVLLIDDQGNILRQASPGLAGQLLDVPQGLPYNISQSIHGMFTSFNGQTYVYAAYPLNKTDASSAGPQAILLCQLRTNLAFVISGVIAPFIWTGIIALIISLLLAVWLARSFYRPIQRLSRAANNIAQGHYDSAVPLDGPKEVEGLAKNFNEMAAKINESQQHLRHYVADVSHQLKSPLTSIQGFAQAIQDGTAADETTRLRAAAIIEEESKRMLRQVNELLELSRMQSGQLSIQHESVDVKDIILHSQEILAVRLGEKDITIENDLVSPMIVMGDADRLEDVINNILDNAIKNTPSHEKIWVSSTLDKSKLMIRIKDSGPGIPPEQIPHIFDRFQPASGLRTGFGLGLAIAREIVLKHGGDISVTNNPGEGANFTVSLPLK
jgi:two-component system, OmpR family, sensor kinase